MTDTAVDTIIPISRKKYINEISHLGAENKFLKEKENLYKQALKQPRKLTLSEEYNVFDKIKKEKEREKLSAELKIKNQLLKEQEEKHNDIKNTPEYQYMIKVETAHVNLINSMRESERKRRNYPAYKEYNSIYNIHH